MQAIDLFAGAGGFSTGATMAGVQVIWAANHWPLAVEYHAANHPGAAHQCQDLHQANWGNVPKHDLLLASPCCQGHSPARGKAHGNPQHDASRSTAWAVVSAAEHHKPAAAVIENVPEFLEWALYPAWSMAMEALGYKISPHIVDAADHGVPQHRERLFIAATRSKAPLQLKLDRRDHISAASFIDFNAGRWSDINKPGRSPRTLARVASGRAAHGHRFLAPYYGSGSGATGRSLQRPIGTITTKDRWSLIDGERMRMLTAQECRAAMGFPADYQLPPQHHKAVHLLGKACNFGRPTASQRPRTNTNHLARGFTNDWMDMSLYLSPQEVDDLCTPLTQRAAQKRFIEKVLGIPVAGRRPDGVPIVGRAVAEERLKQKQATEAQSRGFNWRK